jgi:hypothetical protein
MITVVVVCEVCLGMPTLMAAINWKPERKLSLPHFKRFILDLCLGCAYVPESVTHERRILVIIRAQTFLFESYQLIVVPSSVNIIIKVFKWKRKTNNHTRVLRMNLN